MVNNLKEIIAVACDECGGAGFLFWGDENNYDVTRQLANATQNYFIVKEEGS